MMRSTAPARLARSLAFTAAAVIVTAVPAGAQSGSPAGPVPVEALRARRAAVLDGMEEGIAVLRSASERPSGAYAQDSDYREDNDFFYLTGLEARDSWLVLAASREGPDRVWLFLPPRDPRTEVWSGPRPAPGSEAVTLTGIPEILPTSRFPGELQALLRERSGEVLWTALVATPEALCAGQLLGQGQCAPALRGIELQPGAKVRDLRPLLNRLRSIKDSEEVRRLRRAVSITAAAHEAAMAELRPGLWEYELEAVIEYTFRRLGAERVGFPSIVGSGPNSTVLHYDQSRRRMAAGDLVVVDIGAEYGYYTADVTRTYPVSGTFTPRQRALYDLVLGAQEAALEAVKPGVTLAELTRIAQEYLRANSAGLCGTRTCDHYFVHGLSHHIGMDVHDAGAAGPLQAGMVITLEPGVYLPAEELGIRIEDDVLVTPSGHELLSGAAPRRAADVERALAAGRRARTTNPQNP